MKTARFESLALLHADAENYTVRMSRDPAGTVRAIRWSRSVFTKIISHQDGRVINRVGDNLIAAFSDAPDAVRAAIAIQERLVQPLGRRNDLPPLPFRIGLDYGNVSLTGMEVYGEIVNRVARIQEAAEPNGVLASESLIETTKRLDGISFLDEGVQQLRGLHGHLRLFRISRANNPASVAGRRRPAGQLQTPDIPSIIVLPFRNASKNGKVDYLVDGLTEELISSLSSFRQLFVIGRASSFVYKGRPTHPKILGSELGVQFIVEGSVRIVRGKIRIAIELTSTVDGRILWSSQIERPLEDIFTLQDEIGRLLVVSLIGEVGRVTLRSSLAKGTTNLKAYDLILRGEHELFRYTAEANSVARGSFELALQLDQLSSRAHSLIARTHIYDWRYRWSRDAQGSLDIALNFAKKAVRLDPIDARGQANVAWVLLYRKELEASLRAYERAHELNPNDADILALWADAVSYAGDPARALEMVDKAKRLNPHFPDIYLWSEADALFALRRYRQVIDCIAQMRDPAEGSRLLAASHAYLGEMEQAKHNAAIVLRRQPGFRVEDWISVQPEADPAELEHFRQGLYLAGLP